MGRENQERVEIRPGAFIWMDAAMKKAHVGRSTAAADPTFTPKPEAPETASVNPGENAAQPRARKK